MYEVAQNSDTKLEKKQKKSQIPRDRLFNLRNYMQLVDNPRVSQEKKSKTSYGKFSL